MCEVCVEAKGCRKNMRVIFVEKSDLIGRVGYVRHRVTSVQRLLRDDGFVAVRSGIRVAPCLRDGGEFRLLYGCKTKRTERCITKSAPNFSNAMRNDYILYYSHARERKTQGGKHKMAVKEQLRVKLKSYDHTLVDAAAAKIVEVAKRNGAEVSGPIPLPTEKEIVTILRAVHKYKDSREQFELRNHKRLIDIKKPSKKLTEELMNIELPAGVDIQVTL